MFRARRALALAGVSGLIVTLAACGSDDDSKDDNGGGTSDTGSSAPWILGTTDTVTALDPAGSYDFASSKIQYNVFQQFLTIPAGAEEPLGDAAESCAVRRPADLHLHPARRPEVLERQRPHLLRRACSALERDDRDRRPDRRRDAPAGQHQQRSTTTAPALADGAIETPDDLTVIFHLNQPDTTFLKFVLSYRVPASIVDEDTFPADKELADDQVVGSGPYMLSQYKSGEQAVLEVEPRSTPVERTPQAPQIFVPYFKDTAPLKTGRRGPARSTSPGAPSARPISPTSRPAATSTVIRGQGAEIRYFVWDVDQ